MAIVYGGTVMGQWARWWHYSSSSSSSSSSNYNSGSCGVLWVAVNVHVGGGRAITTATAAAVAATNA